MMTRRALLRNTILGVAGYTLAKLGLKLPSHEFNAQRSIMLIGVHPEYSNVSVNGQRVILPVMINEGDRIEVWTSVGEKRGATVWGVE